MKCAFVFCGCTLAVERAPQNPQHNITNCVVCSNLGLVWKGNEKRRRRRCFIYRSPLCGPQFQIHSIVHLDVSCLWWWWMCLRPCDVASNNKTRREERLPRRSTLISTQFSLLWTTTTHYHCRFYGEEFWVFQPPQNDKGPINPYYYLIVGWWTPQRSFPITWILGGA